MNTMVDRDRAPTTRFRKHNVLFSIPVHHIPAKGVDAVSTYINEPHLVTDTYYQAAEARTITPDQLQRTKMRWHQQTIQIHHRGVAAKRACADETRAAQIGCSEVYDQMHQPARDASQKTHHARQVYTQDIAHMRHRHGPISRGVTSRCYRGKKMMIIYERGVELYKDPCDAAQAASTIYEHTGRAYSTSLTCVGMQMD